MTQIKPIFKPQTAISIQQDLKKRFNIEYCTDIYKIQSELRKGKKNFQLIDGPPYANGHIHMGHVLNKIQKAIINQQQFMLGQRVIFRPSFDCHGLPIEKKVESNIKEAKTFNIKENPVRMRQECRQFAQDWIKIQEQEFSQLCVFGDWSNNFTTIKGALDILRVFYLAAKNDYIYTALKPVMWSVAEKTSMATAEVEYRQHESKALDIGFRVSKSSVLPLDTRVVIWTTTAWTIPANRAIAFHDNIVYTLFTHQNKNICVAKNLLSKFLQRANISEAEIVCVKDIQGSELADTICEHPFKHLGYDFAVPMISAAYVSETDGTGFVHTAPAHGEEDFQTGKRYKLDIVDVITDDGLFQNAEHFNGMTMKDGAKKVIEELKDSLFAVESIFHQYPYSWRSHTPLIYRPTQQWYLNIDMVRKKILHECESIDWHPISAKNRFISMFEDRPDWCISRQRVHGVPMAIFVDTDGKPVFDQIILDKTMQYLEKHGLDSWWTDNVEQILGNHTNMHYTKIMDVLDVWFDAGTHQYCLLRDYLNTQATNPNATSDLSDIQAFPLDLMFEGSDQHRGYFQALLVLSTIAQLHDTEVFTSIVAKNSLDQHTSHNSEECSYDKNGKCHAKTEALLDDHIRTIPCVKSIATHGFILDAKGRKMSKSLGNVVDPEEILAEYGLDSVRFWAAISDYYDDVIYSKLQMTHISLMVKKIRNTLRYLDACLFEFDGNILPISEWTLLDKCIYARLCQFNMQMREQSKSYMSKDFYIALYEFCDDELSRFYLDINKDILYCDTHTSHARLSALSCFAVLKETLIKWITPVMPVTAQEFDSEAFIKSFDEFDAPNAEHITQWNEVLKLRTAINAQIEIKRAEKTIINSKDALLNIRLPQATFDLLHKNNIQTMDALSNLIRMLVNAAKCHVSISSDMLEIQVEKFDGHTCSRCRRTFAINDMNATQEICNRCESV